LSCWFDEKELGAVIPDEMCRGIDSSTIVLVALTRRYLQKVAGHDMMDNCKKEFLYADQRKGGQKMVGIVMEPGLYDTKEWYGPVGMTLGSQLYVDFSDHSIWQLGNEEQFEAKIKELHKRIVDRIHSQNEVLVSCALYPLSSPFSSTTNLTRACSAPLSTSSAMTPIDTTSASASFSGRPGSSPFSRSARPVSLSSQSSPLIAAAATFASSGASVTGQSISPATSRSSSVSELSVSRNSSTLSGAGSGIAIDEDEMTEELRALLVSLKLSKYEKSLSSKDIFAIEDLADLELRDFMDETGIPLVPARKISGAARAAVGKVAAAEAIAKAVQDEK
jgi:hypothetical protein